jgi:hypothetical protein
VTINKFRLLNVKYFDVIKKILIINTNVREQVISYKLKRKINNRDYKVYGSYAAILLQNDT